MDEGQIIEQNEPEAFLAIQSDPKIVQSILGVTWSSSVSFRDYTSWLCVCS